MPSIPDPYTDPQSQGFFNNLTSSYDSNAGAAKYHVSNLYNNVGATGANQFYTRLPGTLGLTNLTTMLANQGRSDPRVLGQQVGAISRGTQGAQDAAAGSLAGGGWQNLGLGKVLQAAIGQQGQSRIAGAYASDADKAYGRNQANLGLLKSLVFDPQRDYAAIGSGQYSTDQANKNQKNAGYISAIGSIIGALL